MTSRPAAAVVSLAAFLLGGWLPAALHGPDLAHRADACGDGCEIAVPAAAHAACEHFCAGETPFSEPAAPGGGHDCPVCDLIATAASPPPAIVLPTRCDAVSPAFSFAVSLAPRDASGVCCSRGPPTA